MERIRFPRLSLSFPLLLLGLLVLPLVLEDRSLSGFENSQGVSSTQPASQQGEDAPGPDGGEPGFPVPRGGGEDPCGPGPGQRRGIEAGHTASLLRIERIAPGDSWSIEASFCLEPCPGELSRKLAGAELASPCWWGGKPPPARGPPAAGTRAPPGAALPGGPPGRPSRAILRGDPR